MAWIESHQTLRDHPKLLRLSRMLDVPRRDAIGMLHLLWWWALEYAEDGDLSEFDALDIALAADWEGEPEAFVKALLGCGPGREQGFLEDREGRLVLHDWWTYAGKLVARRRSDRERKAKAREADDQPVQRKSDGSPEDVRGTSCATEPNPTEQNPTQPPSSAVARRDDVDRLCDLLADLIAANGSKRPTVTKAWRDAARLMLDKDGRDPEKAARLMRWCQQDEFWRSNVLSMPTFRDKYDQLRLRANATHGNGGRPPTSPTGRSLAAIEEARKR